MSQSEPPSDNSSDQEGSLQRKVEYAQERASAIGRELRKRGGNPSVPDTVDEEVVVDLDSEKPVEEQLKRDLSSDDAVALRKRLSALERVISSWETALDEREQEIDEAFAEAVSVTADKDSTDSWSGEPGESLVVDVGSIATYMSYVVTEIETDDEFTEEVLNELLAVLKDHIDSEEDIHRASAIIWKILVRHEANYFKR